MYFRRETGLGGWITVPGVADVLKYSCIVCWSSREKNDVEHDLKEKDDTIKQRTNEIQVISILILLFCECFEQYNEFTFKTILHHV